MTAKHLIATADSLAITFASNAELASVQTSGIDTTGEASVWTYVYFSFDSLNFFNSRAYSFIGQNNHVTFDHWDSLGVGPAILSNRWMDSDSALLVAERAGGSGIRKRFPTCTITALLMQWPAPPFITEWQISYNCSDSTRRVGINATTGDVVTSVKEVNNQALPIRFELHQNYPNPFNPTSTIMYSVARESFVTLKLYDLLGREVHTLVNGKQEPGNYSRIVDANDLPSGVYFYRLTAATYSETKKMILCK
jgi:hypothetical protein